MAGIGILDVGTHKGQTKAQLREGFLDNRVRRQDDHLIWLGQVSVLTGEPIGYWHARGDRIFPGYVLAYMALKGTEPKNLARICSEVRCVAPDHWKAELPRPKSPTPPRPRRAPRKELSQRKNRAEIGLRIYKAGTETCDAGHDLTGGGAHRTSAANGSITCRMCRRIYDQERSVGRNAQAKCSNGHLMLDTRASTSDGITYCRDCSSMPGFTEGNCQDGMGPHSLREHGFKAASGQMQCRVCYNEAMCANGLHRLSDPEHLMFDSKGYRRCRTCRNAKRREKGY